MSEQEEYTVEIKSNGVVFKATAREWFIAKAAAKEMQKEAYTNCPIVRKVNVMYAVMTLLGIALAVKVIWG